MTSVKALPRKLDELVKYKTPLSITDEKEYDKYISIMECLMGLPKRSKGQEIYLSTICDLVEVYEAKNYPIDTSDISGLDMLKFFMDDRQMTATDLGKLLGGSSSLGSKILKGQRRLTLDHVKILSKYFCLPPHAFMD